jgi:hypothetical protein
MILSVIACRVAPVLCGGLFLSLVSTAALALDERCGQLVALHKQYRGVELTGEQQDIKVQLVSWYKANCRPSARSARHSPGTSRLGYASQY